MIVIKIIFTNPIPSKLAVLLDVKNALKKDNSMMFAETKSFPYAWNYLSSRTVANWRTRSATTADFS